MRADVDVAEHLFTFAYDEQPLRQVRPFDGEPFRVSVGNIVEIAEFEHSQPYCCLGGTVLR